MEPSNCSICRDAVRTEGAGIRFIPQLLVVQPPPSPLLTCSGVVELVRCECLQEDLPEGSGAEPPMACRNPRSHQLRVEAELPGSHPKAEITGREWTRIHGVRRRAMAQLCMHLSLNISLGQRLPSSMRSVTS